ncbi:MAG: acetolactate decarboxylase [Ruminococcaceae bacterium]|nr:acetolactate decarboxylase [Oscillospiraceae bacterium]
MNDYKMFQVSTLQALMLGYTKSVITVEELLKHGDTGLGTFEDVDGEMIVLDGHCYQAKSDGTIYEADGKTGVPFCAVSFMNTNSEFDIENVSSIEDLKQFLDVAIDEAFALNSMHVVRVDGLFNKVMARSEDGLKSRHVELKKILENNQQDFCFENIKGTLVCVYFPDYMDGINAPGWHLHFVSADRTCGGHVFDIDLKHGKVEFSRISTIEIKFPATAEFDTYALKEASDKDIKAVEQGK